MAKSGGLARHLEAHTLLGSTGLLSIVTPHPQDGRTELQDQ